MFPQACVKQILLLWREIRVSLKNAVEQGQVFLQLGQRHCHKSRRCGMSFEKVPDDWIFPFVAAILPGRRINPQHE